MDEQIITRLRILADKIELIEKINKKLEQKNELWEDIKYYIPKAVEEYDRIQKEKFYKEYCGTPPKKPSAFENRLNFKKTGKEYIIYKKELAAYNERCRNADVLYLQRFAEAREWVASDEKDRKKAELKHVEADIKRLKEELSSVQIDVAREDIIPSDLKNIEDIIQLAAYLKRNRANSISEAINILYEDKHRRKVEQLQDEIKKISTQARDTADEAYNIAIKSSSSIDDIHKSINSIVKQIDSLVMKVNTIEYDYATKSMLSDLENKIKRIEEQAEDAYSKADELYSAYLYKD